MVVSSGKSGLSVSRFQFYIIKRYLIKMHMTYHMTQIRKKSAQGTELDNYIDENVHSIEWGAILKMEGLIWVDRLSFLNRSNKRSRLELGMSINQLQIFPSCSLLLAHKVVISWTNRLKFKNRRFCFMGYFLLLKAGSACDYKGGNSL